jgi:hypothetical protein
MSYPKGALRPSRSPAAHGLLELRDRRQPRTGYFASFLVPKASSPPYVAECPSPWAFSQSRRLGQQPARQELGST